MELLEGLMSELLLDGLLSTVAPNAAANGCRRFVLMTHISGCLTVKVFGRETEDEF